MSENAPSFDPAVLLVLQEHDSRLGQIHHRLTHLPEDAELAELVAKRAAVEAAVTGQRAAISELDRRQSELEGKIHDIDAKIDAVSKTLYSGTVTASRELQSLEADIASLKRHRSELEDTELEILMDREPLDAAVAAVDASHATSRDVEADVSERAARERSRLQAEAQTVAAERSTTAALVVPDVLSSYERIRTKNKGIGAARLEHGTCMACRLQLSAVDLDRIRNLSPTAIAFCEECGAILVR